MLTGLLFERIEKTVAPLISFDGAKCLRSRLNTYNCDRCVTSCRQNALTFNNRSVCFSEEKCTECMVCIAECPNDAFSCGFEFSALLSVVSISDKDQPAIVGCGKYSAVKNTTVIPCLGLLSEPFLAAMHSVTQHDFFLDVSNCADCKNGAILDILHKRIQAIIKKLGKSAHLKIRYAVNNDFCQTTKEQQRRFFLNRLKESVVSIGRDASVELCEISDTLESKPLYNKDSNKTWSWLNTAISMLSDDAENKKKLLYSYFYSLKCNDVCTLCPSCSGMCPTGAVKRRTENEKKHLYFISAKCSGCGLCVEFCKKKALTLQPGISESPDAAVKLA